MSSLSTQSGTPQIPAATTPPNAGNEDQHFNTSVGLRPQLQGDQIHGTELPGPDTNGIELELLAPRVCNAEAEDPIALQLADEPATWPDGRGNSVATISSVFQADVAHTLQDAGGEEVTDQGVLRRNCADAESENAYAPVRPTQPLRVDQTIHQRWNARRDWQPLTLRTWFLSAFLMFQLGLLASIEVMQAWSNKNYGLVSITPMDSVAKTFSWAYLPTAIALIVAIGWAALDIDVVRTEVFVQLSKSGGAELDALFDRGLINPFKAFLNTSTHLMIQRRSNYSIVAFCSSFAHVISFFVLPPLQSSLFSVRRTARDTEAVFERMPAFNDTNPLELIQLGDLLLRSIWSYLGFGLGTSISMIQPVGVIPVTPLNPYPDGVGQWNNTSTAYTSRMSCALANASEFGTMDLETANRLRDNSLMPGKTKINFENLQSPIKALFDHLGDSGGCYFEISVPLARGNDPTTDQTDEWYYGGWYFLSARSDANDTSCNRYMFLNINHVAISYTRSSTSAFDFEVSFTQDPTFTGLVCTTSYLEAHNIEVGFGNNSQVPTFTVNETEFHMKARAIPSSTFNSTRFEENLLISLEYAAPNTSFSTMNATGQPTTVQTFFDPLSHYLSNIYTPYLPLFLNASGVAEWAELYLQAAFLQDIDIAARARKGEDNEVFTSMVLVSQQRLVLNRKYTAATEGVLALLVLLNFSIIFSKQKRNTGLPFDPAILASKVALVCNSATLKRLYHGQGINCTALRGDFLVKMGRNISGEVVIDALPHPRDEQRGLIARGSDHQHKTPFVLKKTYSHLALLAFGLLILGSVVTLWAIAHYSYGLDRGSFYIKLDDVNQFAWTIVPVLAVTCLKFFWSLVDAYFRLMQPYISLAHGPQPADTTIALSYQTSLAGWVIVKSFLKRHYMLCAIVTISLLNEVLVVAMAALFKGEAVFVAKSMSFASNVSIRSTKMEFSDASELQHVFQEQAIQVKDSFIHPIPMAAMALKGGAQTAPWTTLDYAFRPQYLQGIVAAKEVGNLSMVTVAVRAEANCSPLVLPSGLFDQVEIPGSSSSLQRATYSYELRDWSEETETTQNSITWENTMFRVPKSRVGANTMHGPSFGTSYSVMNHTGFWGPLWTAQFLPDSKIILPNISSPGPIYYNVNKTRNIQSLPEMAYNATHFAVGWIEYARARYRNTTTWYSTTLPKATFLICKPKFHQTQAKITINPSTHRILAYELIGSPSTIPEADSLTSFYNPDNKTRIAAGLGATFILSMIFMADNTYADNWFDLGVKGDQGSFVTTRTVENYSELVEAGKLGPAVEQAFSTIFSQWAAIPGTVFVPSSESEQSSSKGHLYANEDRIVVSTTAMIIVATLLVLLIAALALLPWWTRAWESTLEGFRREPDVIGAILGYICDSEEMLRLFEGRQFESDDEIKAFLKEGGWKFNIGKFFKNEGGGRGMMCFGVECEEGTDWI